MEVQTELSSYMFIYRGYKQNCISICDFEAAHVYYLDSGWGEDVYMPGAMSEQTLPYQPDLAY